MNTKKWFNVSSLEKKYGRMSLGLFLRIFREAEGASQAQYARKLGISRANLCDLEKERRQASPARASKIALRLGVPECVLVQLALEDSLRDAKLPYRVELKAA